MIDKSEHDCIYATMIRAQAEWQKDDNGKEVCVFCHVDRNQAPKAKTVRKA